MQEDTWIHVVLRWEISFCLNYMYTDELLINFIKACYKRCRDLHQCYSQLMCAQHENLSQLYPKLVQSFWFCAGKFTKWPNSLQLEILRYPCLVLCCACVFMCVLHKSSTLTTLSVQTWNRGLLICNQYSACYLNDDLAGVFMFVSNMHA